MSEIRTFGLEKRTKLSSNFRRSDFGHSGCSVRSIVRLYYKRPKSESSVGQVDQPNVWNPNYVNRSDFGQCLKSELFHNRTKSKNAKIQTFRFRTFTVLEVIYCTEEEHIYTANWHMLVHKSLVVEGWVGGWINGRAGLMIAYSNQKFDQKSQIK